MRSGMQMHQALLTLYAKTENEKHSGEASTECEKSWCGGRKSTKKQTNVEKKSKTEREGRMRNIDSCCGRNRGEFPNCDCWQSESRWCKKHINGQDRPRSKNSTRPLGVIRGKPTVLGFCGSLGRFLGSLECKSETSEEARWTLAEKLDSKVVMLCL